MCLPDKMPRNERDRAKLFHKVYSYAEKVGVLGCPYYNETVIDDVLDRPQQLREMVHLNALMRTDLLSVKTKEFYN